MQTNYNFQYIFCQFCAQNGVVRKKSERIVQSNERTGPEYLDKKVRKNKKKTRKQAVMNDLY